MRSLIPCLLTLLVLSHSVRGQHFSPSYRDVDTVWLEQLLYQGKEWRPRVLPVSGHEFFLTSGYTEASLTLEGITFRGLRVKYDIFSDELIILWKDVHAVVLTNSHIDEFTLFAAGGARPGSGYYERRFINLGDRYKELKGFAEVIYQGRSMVVARHTKTIARHISASTYAQYRDNTRYWFITGTECSPLRNRKSFLSLMGEYGDEVKQYIRQNHITLGIFSPEGFGIAAEYYDSLASGREAKD